MCTPSKRALIVIDLQSDYFPGGLFPLWNTEGTLRNIVAAISRARSQGIPVIHVQHVANAAKGIAPFFNAGTPGAEIHPDVLAAAPDGPVIIKEFADSFYGTTLDEVLSELGVDELLVCGMMTHNCVTHTAVSKRAEKYKVTVLTDCATTVSEILHLIALNALSTSVTLQPAAAVL